MSSPNLDRQNPNQENEQTASMESIETPMANLVQSLVAELDEMESKVPEESAAETAEEPQDAPEPEIEPENKPEPLPEIELPPVEPKKPKKKGAMLEQQGTVHINVEEALAALPQEEQDDIPDIRIPEIYARAKYIPTNSQKWAQEAARDVEDDWEGFDPDNEDWTEEEEKSHPLLTLIVGIVLLASVILAFYSYYTSDLTGGIAMTLGSIV